MQENKDLQPISDIDRVVHSPARLKILAFLAAVDSADFIFLMNQVDLTRGNLSSHLNTLEDAGYISIQKEFVDKVERSGREMIIIKERGHEFLSKLNEMKEFEKTFGI